MQLYVYFSYRALFWTNGTSLFKSTLAGGNVQILHNSACTVIYLSLISGKLYFTQNACTPSSDEGIYAYDLANDQVDDIFTVAGSYRGVTRYGNNVYWVEHKKVFSAPAAGGGPKNEIKEFTGSSISLRGITVIDSSLQP